MTYFLCLTSVIIGVIHFLTARRQKKHLLPELSAPEHYAVFNPFAIDVEIIECAPSYNDCAEDFKPVPASYGLIHNWVDYSSQDNRAPDNSKCERYVAFNAIANCHDVFYFI